MRERTIHNNILQKVFNNFFNIFILKIRAVMNSVNIKIVLVVVLKQNIYETTKIPGHFDINR